MRIFWIQTVFLLFFLSIIIRLFYWQVVRAEFLQSQAENQHFTDTKIDATRGNILFSDESILASSNPVFSLYGLPKAIATDQKVKVAYLIAKVLSEDPTEVDTFAKDVTAKLSQNLYWVQLEKNISIEQQNKLKT